MADARGREGRLMPAYDDGRIEEGTRAAFHHNNCRVSSSQGGGNPGAEAYASTASEPLAYRQDDEKNNKQTPC